MAISVYLKSRSLSLYLQLETASDKILMVSRIVSELKVLHELYSLIHVFSGGKQVIKFTGVTNHGEVSLL